MDYSSNKYSKAAASLSSRIGRALEMRFINNLAHSPEIFMAACDVNDLLEPEVPVGIIFTEFPNQIEFELYVNDGKFLEIGCNDSRYMRDVISKNPPSSMVAIDINPNAIERSDFYDGMVMEIFGTRLC